jgi:dihydroxyacid dehydratase/phosphogluconate dehydratase
MIGHVTPEAHVGGPIAAVEGENTDPDRPAGTPA